MILNVAKKQGFTLYLQDIFLEKLKREGQIDPPPPPSFLWVHQKHSTSRKKHLNDSKSFVEFLNTMDDVYNNIDDYNSRRNKKILIIFDERRLKKTFTKKIHKNTQTNHIRC